jgi:hypothetical protein
MNKQDKINRILTDMDNLGKAYQMAEALGRVENDKDLYLLAKAISPKSIASGWTRRQILETIEDVLLSRA